MQGIKTAGEARIDDGHVDLLKEARLGFENRSDGLAAGDVHRKSGDFDPVAAAEPGCKGFKPLQTPAREDERVSLLRKPAGTCLSNSAGSSSDEDQHQCE